MSAAVADALRNTLISPNVADSNLEAANVVDVLQNIAFGTRRIAAAITPNVPGTRDETGGHVESLTEAVLGMTAGLCRIADAISELASAVRQNAQ